MFYQANTIANYVLYFCDINDIPISNLKLQKILWFLQLDYLVIRGTPLFVEDCIYRLYFRKRQKRNERSYGTSNEVHPSEFRKNSLRTRTFQEQLCKAILQSNTNK